MNLMENKYKPICFWGWNGAINHDEICWQIDEFKKNGAGGFFIHSRAGLLKEYMGKEWLDACETAVKHAQKVGICAWLYDEDGWPSGFGGGKVNGCGTDYMGKQLFFSEQRPAGENDRIIAKYNKKDNNQYQLADQYGDKDGDLYCYYTLVPHYVDIMNQKVTRKFIATTHEVYKNYLGEYFGTVIKGIFTDEPQMPNGPCWSESLVQCYKANYGENILDKLWLMHVNNKYAPIFRYRFWKCVNELVNNNFVKEINTWCLKNNLLFTGHFPSEDGLIQQVTTTGGVMPLYCNMGMPGIDHLGNRYAPANLIKQVTSVAHRNNMPYIISESFGCTGWDVSFKELLGIAEWQTVLGINTFCIHLAVYSIVGRRKRDYPAFFSYHEPWWDHIPVLWNTMTNLNKMLAEGRRTTKVAVLSPIRSIWCLGARNTILDGKYISAQYRDLIDNLLDIHVDFDILDESELAVSQSLEGRIVCGSIGYTWLIIPECITLSEKSIDKILQFVNSGGKVVFINGRPKSVEGNEEHPKVSSIKEIRADDIQNTRNILQKYFRRNPIWGDVRILDSRMLDEVTGIVSSYKRTDDGATLFLFNKVYGHEVDAVIQHRGKCIIETVDIINNAKQNVTYSFNGEFTYAKISVPPQQGTLLKISKLDTVVIPYEYIVTKSEQLNPVSVRLLNDNCLTLDYGRYRINNGIFSERMAIIHMLDEIYSKISGCEEKIKLEIQYEFHASFSRKPQRIKLSAENMTNSNIKVNSHNVGDCIGWSIDKEILDYDITNFVNNGENSIILQVIIPETQKTNDLLGKFESERNRFFYEVEPESMYISGDFDVRCNTTVQNRLSYYTVMNTSNNSGAFTIVDKSVKDDSDLTLQNAWFYKGNCEYTVYLDYELGKKKVISIKKLNCTCADIYINKRFVSTVISEQDSIDITPWMLIGQNELNIVAIGHNRNLLGPHHHVFGKLYFTGPSSFEGKKGFEDFLNPEIDQKVTWTDDYSFVPFSLGQITVSDIIEKK